MLYLKDHTADGGIIRLCHRGIGFFKAKSLYRSDLIFFAGDRIFVNVIFNIPVSSLADDLFNCLAAHLCDLLRRL